MCELSAGRSVCIRRDESGEFRQLGRVAAHRQQSVCCNCSNQETLPGSGRQQRSVRDIVALGSLDRLP